jgi:hypothetical protein
MITDVFAYGMSKEILNEASRSLGITSLTKTLTENGYEVQVPGVVAASPSKEVVFSLIAKKDNRLVAVDLAHSDTEVEVEPVLQLYIKLLEETSPMIAILAVVPTLSKKARDVASLHKITVAEGPNAQEVSLKILKILESALPASSSTKT